jgi:hypothetical protein
MSSKILIWSPEQATKELRKRLEIAKRYRKRFEDAWEISEMTVYGRANRRMPSIDPNWVSDITLGGVDEGTGEVSVNYAFKHFRFIHAQLSANPPTVIPRPTSSDNEDRRKADAADRLIRHALRQYAMQEHIDQASLCTLLYGTGIIKTVWDSLLGDIAEFDEQTGEIVMEGDMSFKNIIPKRLWIDPDAKKIEDIRWTFEAVTMTYDEAMFRWPDKKEELEKARKQYHTTNVLNEPDDQRTDLFTVYEYYEKGMPINGMLGRYAVVTEDGTQLEQIRPNPFRFSPVMQGSEKQRKQEMERRGLEFRPAPATAYLPYHFLTDIDVPDQVYGKSFIEYEASIQDTINRLDCVTLDNIQAHGVSRMVLPEGAEIAEQSITNSPWDIVKITGSQPPHFVQPPTLMPDMSAMRDRLQAGGADVAGINEAMMGQMSRETSGFSLQYATNQGNMIRRRLFNKYVSFVESIYKAYLNMIRKHWDEKHIIYVLGKEKAFEAVDIKGADIDGGFDLVVEYGASLSLDPMTRREEIMTMMPVLEKAGIPTKTILSMMKLNELEGIYDRLQLSEDRQREIFEEMTSSGRYIPPEDLQEHVGMLDYAYTFVMTSEFKYLPVEQQALIKQHIKEREQMAAAKASPAALPNPPGPLPAGLPEGSQLPPGPTEAPAAEPAIPAPVPEG